MDHGALTHRSENVAAALGVTVPLLQDLLDGQAMADAAPRRARSIRVPRITGEAMFALYRESRGPGNIPSRKMWELHVDLSDDPFDLDRWVAENAVEEVVLKQLGTACYPEHGLPLSFFLAASAGYEPRASLLANANAGGDNVHRGAVLGLLVGAGVETFPESLIEGLADAETLGEEIRAFAAVAGRDLPW